jgi:hypothetical protein
MHRAFTGRCWAAVCTLAVIAASGCLGGSGGASSVRPSTAREHIRVTSSLADLKVAPAYVHWVADPSLKRQDVREVRFYVDGKLSWIDPEKPYTYGGDGGFLVTSWLADIADDGAHTARFTQHTFTTEAVAIDGSLAQEKVVLRVPSLKKMPNLPYGIWGSPVGGPPWPRALDVLSPGVLWIGAPIENATAYEVEADGGTLRILAPIRKGPGGTGVTEQGWHFDSYDCGPSGPFAVYRWSFGPGPTLRLTAVRDPCAARRHKLQGTWEGLD